MANERGRIPCPRRNRLGPRIDYAKINNIPKIAEGVSIRAATEPAHRGFRKTAFLAIVIGLAMSFCAIPARGQGHLGTPHDFTGLPWLGSRMFCTACHNGLSAAWGHRISSSTYTVSTSTLADVGQPDGDSAQCLGCHEGRPDGPALDDFGSSTTGTAFMATGAAFGTDLRHHHPVSFTFDSTLATAHGGLNDPSTSASGLPAGGTISQDMLDSGKVQCTTCHDPHFDANGSFLVATSTTLCFTCHTETLPAGTAGRHHIPGRDDPWISGNCTLCHGDDLLGDGAAPACESCHAPFAAPNPPPSEHHGLRRDDPWVSGNCTSCHGADLLGDGAAPACVTCHAPFTAPDPPPAGHHGENRFDPLNDCSGCHGAALEGAPYGSITTPACNGCHGNLWEGANRPPLVDAGGPYTGYVGLTTTFDASATIDTDGDPLWYQWTFGDGGPSQPFAQNAVAAHLFDAAGTYTGTLAVTDGVTDPVTASFIVEISSDQPPAGPESWTITTTTNPPERFSISIEDHDGVLVMLKDDGVVSPSLALGIEFDGVIFWMDIWMDVSGNVFWGSGSMYFGNVDRETGTMSGVVFDEGGGMATFRGTRF